MPRPTSVLLALCLLACDGPGEPVDAGSDAGLSFPDDGWETRAPEEVGLDSAALEAVRAYAFAPERNTQGVVIVRRGVIAAEWYDDRANRESYAASWSVGKSVASALVGIAIDDGLIGGVDVPMTDYFPEWSGTPREGITLEHVLQMATGLEWSESYDVADRAESDVIALVLLETSQLDYARARPLAEEPGSRFLYSSGNSQLLSGVLEQATGIRADQYAEERLFGPLGIESAQWWRDTAGQTLTYCCLDMRSRDFARFGQLYLDGGSHAGAQVVPADWVAASIVPGGAFDGYGYQWWLDGRRHAALPDDVFAAHGHDGQSIFVVPSLELVVVRNGTYYKARGEPVADPSLFARYPSDGLVGNRGTHPPAEWDDVEFLGAVIDAVVD